MTITIIKNDHTGREVWRYDGRVLARGAGWVQLEARFNRPDGQTDYHTDYHTYREGDRFVEWFYADRWYSIFEMHDVDDDRIVGWYCNFSRPARFDADTVRADDLALDLFVTPDGALRVLDEEEFAVLPLDEATRGHVCHALEELKRFVVTRQPPFDGVR